MDSQSGAHILAEGRFLRVLRRSGWEWVERTNTTGAVVIAAITSDRQLVLIDQFRIPLDRRVIELPAGLVGDLAESKDERLVEAARRELLEETGYAARDIECLFDGPSSSGLTNETFTMVLAKDVQKVGCGGGDETEDIRVHVVPLAEIETWLALKREAGFLISPKIYSALYFIARQPAPVAGLENSP
jgi:ADP-ribose pyrophosphatase